MRSKLQAIVKRTLRQLHYYTICPIGLLLVAETVLKQAESTLMISQDEMGGQNDGQAL
ncbi:hypothetical protein METHB2_100059 [Candidatus Methylobacter favarea]|uniref:Uncharacterized protein n=1 Tax=Candidatus Methylobacter favarea TaxID=2707345 RepID=A0A8S0Y5N1_9GAMM|nr:hypothetical protein METHB2_100059 [Candidatus Methylobacter favarea]